MQSFRKKWEASPEISIDNYIWVGRKIECHSLVDIEHQETNGRCKRFHDRELPLLTWLVARMQVLSTKSIKIES